MLITRTQGAFVPRKPDEVFAVIDDLSSMHRWLDRCIRVQKYHSGENAEGDALRCVYQGLTGHGVMNGSIVVRQPGIVLGCNYFNAVVSVSFDISLIARGEGTYLTHSVRVILVGWLARLSRPLAYRLLDSHVVGTMVGLRHCLLVAG